MLQCAHCGTTAEVDYVCSRCNSVFYCGGQCQLMAWKLHKHVCGQKFPGFGEHSVVPPEASPQSSTTDDISLITNSSPHEAILDLGTKIMAHFRLPDGQRSAYPFDGECATLVSKTIVGIRFAFGILQQVPRSWLVEVDHVPIGKSTCNDGKVSIPSTASLSSEGLSHETVEDDVERERKRRELLKKQEEDQERCMLLREGRHLQQMEAHKWHKVNARARWEHAERVKHEDRERHRLEEEKRRREDEERRIIAEEKTLQLKEEQADKRRLEEERKREAEAMKRHRENAKALLAAQEAEQLAALMREKKLRAEQERRQREELERLREAESKAAKEAQSQAIAELREARRQRVEMERKADEERWQARLLVRKQGISCSTSGEGQWQASEDLPPRDEAYSAKKERLWSKMQELMPPDYLDRDKDKAKDLRGQSKAVNVHSRMGVEPSHMLRETEAPQVPAQTEDAACGAQKQKRAEQGLQHAGEPLEVVGVRIAPHIVSCATHSEEVERDAYLKDDEEAEEEEPDANEKEESEDEEHEDAGAELMQPMRQSAEGKHDDEVEGQESANADEELFGMHGQKEEEEDDDNPDQEDTAAIRRKVLKKRLLRLLQHKRQEAGAEAEEAQQVQRHLEEVAEAKTEAKAEEATPATGAQGTDCSPEDIEGDDDLRPDERELKLAETSPGILCEGQRSSEEGEEFFEALEQREQDIYRTRQLANDEDEGFQEVEDDGESMEKRAWKMKLITLIQQRKLAKEQEASRHMELAQKHGEDDDLVAAEEGEEEEEAEEGPEEDEREPQREAMKAWLRESLQRQREQRELAMEEVQDDEHEDEDAETGEMARTPELNESGLKVPAEEDEEVRSREAKRQQLKKMILGILPHNSVQADEDSGQDEEDKEKTAEGKGNLQPIVSAEERLRELLRQKQLPRAQQEQEEEEEEEDDHGSRDDDESSESCSAPREQEEEQERALMGKEMPKDITCAAASGSATSSASPSGPACALACTPTPSVSAEASASAWRPLRPTVPESENSNEDDWEEDKSTTFDSLMNMLRVQMRGAFITDSQQHRPQGVVQDGRGENSHAGIKRDKAEAAELTRNHLRAQNIIQKQQEAAEEAQRKKNKKQRQEKHRSKNAKSSGRFSSVKGKDLVERRCSMDAIWDSLNKDDAGDSKKSEKKTRCINGQKVLLKPGMKANKYKIDPEGVDTLYGNAKDGTIDMTAAQKKPRSERARK